MPIMTGTCPECGKFSHWTEDKPCDICREKELKQKTLKRPDPLPLDTLMNFNVQKEQREIRSVSEEIQSKMPTETKAVFQMNAFELAWREFKKLFKLQ
jgi:hypothetical protein